MEGFAWLTSFKLGKLLDVSPIPTSRIHSTHPRALILGDPNSAVQTRSKVSYKFWKAHAFVNLPYGKKAIIYKVVCETKKDERGVVVRNKASIGSYIYILSVENGYRRGTIDKTLFLKKDKHDIILVQVYVDDIIFGSTKKSWCDEFEALMKSSDFRGVNRESLQILKKFDFANVKTASTPIETQKPLVKDEEASDVDVHLYRKSTTGGCQFLGRRLISWQCKKQTIVATSTTEAEYVAAASCCGQVLWIQNQMHHFIRDAYEKKLIQVLKIHTNDNVADLLTKAFDVSSKMAVLDSCPKHNMVAYLDKSEGNVEFHEIIDFLTRSSIHHALTVSPIVSTTFVEKFWTSAKSKTINNVRHITAKVAGKSVSISEASIRSDLLFDDADGIDTLPNQDIFDAIQRMGYEGDLTVLTFNKALFSPQWRFLFHTINHCLSSKSTSWDQIPTNIATAVICLTSNQKYNFSKLIFDGMLRHLDAKKKFVMYPRFISIFLGKQLVDVSVPLDHFPVNTLTSKVFSFMVKKGKHFSGKVTPLFATMLVQPTQDEGASSERPSEALPTPSPAPTSEVPYEPQTDSSPSHAHTLLRNEGDMTIQGVYDLCLSLCKQQRFPRKSFSKKHRVHKESVSKQGRKIAKGESLVQRDPLFDVMPEDKIDHMETKMLKVKGTDEQVEGNEVHNEGMKRKIKEEDESESESDGIPQAEKKFKQLESDEELARKVQEEWEAEEERNRIAEENAANEEL
ncbi:hypothetical protein Tco_0586410 [Tanacetum coccineum]